MWWIFLIGGGILLYGQVALLRLADSLTIYGRPGEALTIYDSILRSPQVSDTLRLQAYAGSLRSLLGLRRWEELYARADSAERLALYSGSISRYVQSLSVRGAALTQQRRYAEAETTLKSASRMVDSLSAEEPVLGAFFHYIGFLMHVQSRYEEAQEWYQKARDTRRRALGTEHPDYALTLNNLANLHKSQGRYTEAERLHLEAKRIRERLFGTTHPEYAVTLNNLGNVYSAQGRYAEAERLYLEVRDIWARLGGIDHPAYAGTLNNLANVYSAQGRYVEAERLYLEVKDIQFRQLGMDHPHYAQTLANLAGIYHDQGDYIKAERLYLEAGDIQARVLGSMHPDYATTLNNLAGVYSVSGRYAQAEKLYQEVRGIQARVLGSDHPAYAITLNNLAIVLSAQGRYDEAEKLHLEARDIRARMLGTSHPAYYQYSLYNLAKFYQSQKRYAESDLLWKEAVQKTFQRIQRDLPIMPSAHRRYLVENVMEGRLTSFQGYVAERSDPTLIEHGYRAARSMKGILLSSTEAMKHLVETRSQDSVLQELYATWRRLTEQYAFYTLQEDYTAADSLWDRATQTERKIVERLPQLRTFLPDLNTEPLFPPLRKGEVAIEVARVPDEKSDTILYLFYLLDGTRNTLRLHTVRLDTLWEQRAITAYEVLSSPGAAFTRSAYSLLWGFIDSLLPAGVKVVYFSPDGIYYRVNIASLYDGRQFVIDRYEVRYVATTRRLLSQRPDFPAGKPVVVGNPDFSGAGISVSEKRERSYRTFINGIPSLPGAEAEVRAIAHILGADPVVGAAATEGYIKNLRSPQVLHIATHGYFSGTGREPMLEGGLLLAQAALWDSLYPPLGAEDGRLTAQEASTLQLLGTDLVVLSACETGLGEIRGEGLYGLQRAFLEAGASRVVTALWQIDDEATRALMEDFYRRWQVAVRSAPTGRDAGTLVDMAFTQTLRAFRQRYTEPYYWGAFVMMR